MKRWSAEDDAKLLELYEKRRPLKEIVAAFPGKTRDSVRHRGRRMGLDWSKVKRPPAKHPERALELIRQEPRTSADVGRLLGIHRSSAWSVVRALAAVGKIHVVHYDNTHPGPVRPVYSTRPPHAAPQIVRPTKKSPTKTVTAKPDPAAAWLFAPRSIDNE